MVVLVRAGMDDGPASTKTGPTQTAPTQTGPAKPSATKPKTPAAGTRTYTVRAGDTLASIAASTGVSVARLRQLNPKVEPTSLFIGDTIRLQ